MSFEAVVVDVGADVTSLAVLASGDRPRFAFCRQYPRGQFEDIFEMLDTYRGAVPDEAWPADLSLSVLGTIEDGFARLDDTGYKFSLDEVASRYGFEDVFAQGAAASLTAALPLLEDQDTLAISPPPGVAASGPAEGRVAVISVGDQGVGVAAADRLGGEERILDSVAQHATFAPTTEDEAALRDYLRRTTEHVSWGTALGRAGLPGLYALSCEREGDVPQSLRALEIVLYGRTGTDAHCAFALDTFIRLVGRFAGDVALQTGAFGGVYLSSYIARSMHEAMERAGLRDAFQDKPGATDILARTPLDLIVNQSPRLLGAARHRAETLARREVKRRGDVSLPSVLRDARACDGTGVVVLSQQGTIETYTDGLFSDAPLPPDTLRVGERFDAVGAALADIGQISLAERNAARERAVQGRAFEMTRQSFGGRRFLLTGAKRPCGGTIVVEREVTNQAIAEAEMRDLARSLREAKAKADAASRAKSEFLANMSHEIRTPMNGVLGMADILSRTPLNAEQTSMVDVITGSAQGLLTVINDILDFSKVEAGKMRLDPRPFDLQSLTEDVAAAFGAQADQRGIELLVRYAPGTPRGVVGDAGRLRQALTNIVGNAVKFTAEGHVLIEVAGEVSDEDGQAALTFTVTDTGCGIPKAEQEAIFEIFGQADATATRAHEGTGLGLNITRAVVDLMGGQTRLVSEEGEGTVFTIAVDLPTADVDLPGGADVPVADLTGRRLLIVDDNAVNRRILAEQARSWGMSPVCVPSGPAALSTLAAAKAQGEGFDACVLDFQMPGMSGVALGQALRAAADTAALPLILLTSVGHAAETEGFDSARFDEALVKPARASQLQAAIAGAIIRSGAASMRRPEGSVLTVTDAEPVPRAAAETATEQGASGPQAEPATGAPPTADPAGVHDGPPLRVLVAEDNPVNRMVVAAMLKSGAYDVVMAEDGLEAVEAFKSAPFDVVLMDISMPRLDGLEATRTIRSLEESASETGSHPVRTPIIGVTAHAVGDVRSTCLEAGMDDYVAKPVQQKDVLDAISRAVPLRRTA